MKYAGKCMSMFYILLLILTLGCGENFEYFEDYPHLTNETLGMTRYFNDAAKGGQDYFKLQAWGDAVIGIPGEMAGGVNWLRYELSFAATAMSMAAEWTPAYRKPYVEAIDGMVQKMLHPHAWDYWLEEDWGGDDPIHPYNIMYTGHLQIMMALHERHAGNQKYMSDVDLFTDDGSQMWTTNLNDLSADIHNLILTNQDSAGDNYYAIPCETPMVFPVCNSVPQLAMELLPSSLGLDPEAVHAPWRSWLEENMFDTDTNYFYLKYQPFEDPPYLDASLAGAYNAWTWNYINGFYPEWVEESYPTFKENAFERGLEGPETAVILFGAPGGDIGEGLLSILDLGGTGMGMVLAKQMGDEEGYEELKKGYKTISGSPGWWDGMYGYFTWIQFGAIPTLWALWADTTSAEINLRSVVESPRDQDFYETPFLADVTNPKTFVNQAIWDDPVLYITVNGGPEDGTAAAPTTLIVQNLKSDRTYQVLHTDTGFLGIGPKSENVYTNWTREGEEIRITTPALTSTKTQMFQIVEEPIS